MAATYSPIATTTLGSNQATVSFTSISGSFTDLILVFSGVRSASGNSYIGLRFNSDTGTNYSDTTIFANTSSTGSGRNSNQSYLYIEQGDAVTESVNNKIIQIMNYANSTTYKTALIRTNNASREVSAVVGLWRSTSAITDISITLLGGTTPNFASGSTFTLYGIASA
jgi:hypothetical protein